VLDNNRLTLCIVASPYISASDHRSRPAPNAESRSSS